MFNIEEIILMNQFIEDKSNIPNRRTLVRTIEEAYELAEDEAVLQMMKSVVKQLTNITDKEYARIDFSQGYCFDEPDTVLEQASELIKEITDIEIVFETEQEVIDFLEKPEKYLRNKDEIELVKALNRFLQYMKGEAFDE